MLSSCTRTACSLFSEKSIAICRSCQIPRSYQLIPGVHCQLICVMNDSFTNALASFVFSKLSLVQNLII